MFQSTPANQIAGGNDAWDDEPITPVSIHARESDRGRPLPMPSWIRRYLFQSTPANQIAGGRSGSC